MIGPQYTAVVRRWDPTPARRSYGYTVAYFSGGYRRAGASRASRLCAHQHPTEGEAQECGERMAQRRNRTGESR